MIKLTQFLRKSQTLYKPILSRYFSAQSNDDLVKICHLLNVRYSPINHEIPDGSKIRLIDGTTGEFYGIYDKEHAL